MRHEDLIPSFSKALASVSPDHKLVAEAAAVCLLTDLGYSVFSDGMAVAELVNDLCDALQEHAPAGHYFGAHEGDGSDYGFWPTAEDEDELDQCDAWPSLANDP